jgi:hypothetical protein
MNEGSIDASAGTTLFSGEAWFDPIEAGIRERVRGFIEDLIEQELRTALGRGRWGLSISGAENRHKARGAGSLVATNPGLMGGRRLVLDVALPSLASPRKSSRNLWPINYARNMLM